MPVARRTMLHGLGAAAVLPLGGPHTRAAIARRCGASVPVIQTGPRPPLGMTSTARSVDG
ncbi:MAG: hypothetical protein JOY66_23735 [Acetobacteraceae bacterium]|nr:hypothetical protein [Acetobacteraceae bacterium]